MRIAMVISGILAALAFIVLIGFAIVWLVGFKRSKKTSSSVGKIGSSISAIVTAILLVIFVGIYVDYNHKNNVFVEKRIQYNLKYYQLSDKLKSISDEETNSWNDDIYLSSGDDYDPADSIDDIESTYSSDFKKIDKQFEQLSAERTKLQKNNTGKYNFEIYNSSFKKVRNFRNTVVNPSGSYNSFSKKIDNFGQSVDSSMDDLRDATYYR
ncbi:DUF948 domain-containing protein [Bombilactobacillus thymidiniphilus]|uniref:DUF948 domain-containing protein n=1 Tax=Bombilactobacillus thymidiniphilus TaxID=2923363 RepID=A0ABY4PE24_9LACO|nr:DUF948 domain-containing protein [Bombilactobacillus thymidiniphilus]UQS83517.1 DUF948 domain-containing protein [Bombilactobacillus thymidiniphilus]